MNDLLSGKNVLVTGAGANIGRSIAIEMAAHGANVYFAEIDEERRVELERELSEYPVSSRGILTDVSDLTSIDALYQSLIRDRINIDVLVNNVGMQRYAAVEDPAMDEWHKMFDTNLFGPVYLSKLVSDKMIKDGVRGSIIFVTSIHQWAFRGIPSYSASKAALGMVIKELAVVLGPHQIRVNGIAPGWIKEDDEQKPFYQRHAPLHKSSINPRYVGRAAIYLAADYFSEYTTGAIIKIDAGLSLYNHLAEPFLAEREPLTLSGKIKRSVKAWYRAKLLP